MLSWLTPWLTPRAYGQRFVTLYSISDDNPIGLAQVNGVLYGATFAYGGSGYNCSTVFELQPPAIKGGPWVGMTLYAFPNIPGAACSLSGAPVVGADGSLYGIASGGAYLGGAIYRVQPPVSPGGAWTESVLYNFGAPGTQLGTPATIVSGPNGSYYILGQSAGANGEGALDLLQPPASPAGTWSATVLYSFATFDLPNSLVARPDGVLYVTAP